MTRPAVAFWREMTIAVTVVLLAVACGTSAQNINLEFQEDAVKIVDQNQATALVESNKIEETLTINKTSKRNVTKIYDNNNNADDEKKDDNHAALAGHVDETKNKFAPKFKHPSKLFDMDMKQAGSSMWLKCVADGNPMPNITWLKNNSSIVRSHLRPTYGKWWLTLDELSKTDNGNYTCLICNELGCISHTVNLQVQEFKEYAVKIVDQNQAAALVENNTIEETLTITSNRTSNIIVAKIHDNKNNADAGHMDDTKKKFAPKFKHPSKLFNMNFKAAGSSMRLRCAADGNPMPNITWFKNNGTIERSYFPPTYGKWWLTLEELSKTDNGNYTCLICNELGCISHTVNLKVIERYPSKPYIKEGYPGNITAVVNDTVQLACPPISDLEPYLYWKKAYDNFTVKDGEVGPNEQSIPDGFDIQSDDPADKPEMLTITNVTQDDQGWYICVAINSLGTATEKGYLTVLDHPVTSNYTDERFDENNTVSLSNQRKISAG